MRFRLLCQLACALAALGAVTVEIAEAAGDSAASDYVLVYHPARYIHAWLKSKVSAPNYDPREWQVFCPVPPASGRQHLQARFQPEGKILADASPAQNGVKVFSAILPGTMPPEFETQLEVEGELYAVDLLPRTKGRKQGPTLGAYLSANERRAFLAPNGDYDFRAPSVAKWLKTEGLARRSGENDLALAKRAYLYLENHFKYYSASAMDRHASATIRERQSDCGGLCVLFGSILRANGIPARCLAGHWATVGDRRDDDSLGDHVKAEFHLAGVGWVPADLSSAVCFGEKPNGLAYFASDPGDFIVFDIDRPILVRTADFGWQSFACGQSIAWWVTGSGPLEARETDDWRVEELPAMANLQR